MAPQRAGRDITKQMLRHRQMVLDQVDFKQKAEEKKMSMSKNIARLAVTAGLTAALSFGGVMAPVTMAFAEGTANGSVTITNANGNETNFKGYKIFDANVVKDENGQTLVSNITWANDKVETAVTEEIKNIDSNASITTAQDAADWIKTHVRGTDETTRVASDSAAYKIAVAVSAVTNLDDSSDYTTTSNGIAKNLSHGYWLFVTDAATVEGVEAATAPIFTVVGDEAINITEKTSIPTVDKKVKEGDTWGKVSDSQIGEEIEYKLTGTVANNIATFDSYKYEFHDTLSKGLEVVKGPENTPKDFRVYIVNGDEKTEVKQDNSNGYKVTVARDNTTKKENLTVAFADLKAVKNAKGEAITVDAKSSIVVTYKAKLNNDAEYTATGNTNEVKLVYSNDPFSNGTGTSTSKEVTDYVFGLDITKVEEGDQNKKLAAGFKVQVVSNGDSGSTNKWLKNDGSLVGTEEEATEFKTDATNGKVFIPGLVAGTYKISETTTPSGYNTIAPFQITVTPNYDLNGKLTGLTVSEEADKVTPGTADGSVMSITIENKKGSGLPLTGLNGVTFTWIAGGAVLCIGVAHLIRSRKQVEESEQE